MPSLSIVIPTIDGREHWLERAERSFRQATVADHEILVMRGFDACGPAWQAGGEQAEGDFLCLAADDIEALEGWDTAAIAACERGVLPAPLIYNGDGSLQSCGGSWRQLEPDGSVTGFTRTPFLSRAQWRIAQPMLPCHYWTDNWVSWRLRQAGVPTVVTYGYRLIHYLAGEGRNEARLGADETIYARATSGEDVWANAS